MLKLMYVPKELRKLSYSELIERQKGLLEQTETALHEAKEVEKENRKIQADLLMTLGNLNKCSSEDLKVMQTIATNYTKIAINKKEHKNVLA
ncbi:hypothetical protein ACODH8_09835 [Vagococcus fluvialis]|uniref:hypothetical protein n=1 Tax=Vagococcus fluvialis TaxID=2738 RepID=UPI003B5AE10F